VCVYTNNVLDDFPNDPFKQTYAHHQYMCCSCYFNIFSIPPLLKKIKFPKKFIFCFVCNIRFFFFSFPPWLLICLVSPFQIYDISKRRRVINAPHITQRAAGWDGNILLALQFTLRTIKRSKKNFPLFLCCSYHPLSPEKKKEKLLYYLSLIHFVVAARLYNPFHFCVLCDGGNECRRRRMDNAQCQYVAAVYGQLPTAKERPKLNVSTFTIYIIQSDLVSSSYRSVAAIQIHTDD
jgi:hypothetical protein